ncbi:hypothetical protein PMN51_17925 [Blautia wexlerae]|jgi:hypothetical protein|nr:hypothetical protein [Blautia wexlerae]
MDKTNFKFIRLNSPNKFKDYWFKTDKTSKNELMNEYIEQGMVGIPFVIFSKDEDIITIKRQFMFNFDFITPTNDKLKSILACMVRGM